MIGVLVCWFVGLVWCWFGVGLVWCWFGLVCWFGLLVCWFGLVLGSLTYDDVVIGDVVDVC
jgi:hypothetical protein